MTNKEKILICGILPPPFFGHSMMYKVLMASEFVQAFEIKFLNLHFWTYGTHKKVTIGKLLKMVGYLGQYIYLIARHRPKYILYNMSFDKMPFLKDYLFCAVGKFLGCKIVIHDMGQYVREFYEGSNGFYKWLIKKFCSMATASIVMGEGTKEFYKGFIDRSRLVVVPGCVSDTAHLYYGDEQENQLDDGYVHVLYFSFLSRSKGVLTALKAIPEAIERNPNVRFVFGGPFESDELKTEILDFIQEHQLEKHVQFLGYVESEEKRTHLLRRTDIFIFPTHRDVFGLVLLHAMAEKVPIIASIEGNIPEIIKDGESGFLITKGDHMQLAGRTLQLADDHALRKAMGEAGRQRYIDVYSPPEYGQKMISAFEHINLMG